MHVHFMQVVARNTALRRREMLEAEAILEEEQSKFQGWQQSLTAIPAISKMQEKFEAMRAEELKKAANKLSNLSDKEMEVRIYSKWSSLVTAISTYV
jgi:glutamyl-tRNA reductase